MKQVGVQALWSSHFLTKHLSWWVYYHSQKSTQDALILWILCKSLSTWFISFMSKIFLLHKWAVEGMYEKQMQSMFLKRSLQSVFAAAYSLAVL